MTTSYVRICFVARFRDSEEKKKQKTQKGTQLPTPVQVSENATHVVAKKDARMVAVNNMDLDTFGLWVSR